MEMSTDEKIMADAAKALAEWALKQSPPLSIIGACDYVLMWADGVIGIPHSDYHLLLMNEVLIGYRQTNPICQMKYLQEKFGDEYATKARDLINEYEEGNAMTFLEMTNRAVASGLIAALVDSVNKFLEKTR